MTLYVNVHVSQYCPGCSAVTRSSGCTWTSGRNGADASSGGTYSRTPDQIHALVKPSEETSPGTPGWSIDDLDLAMSRAGVLFSKMSGTGWANVVNAHNAGQYIVLQGLSAEFGNGTCSGAFNGTHAIGIHPDTDATGRWRIDDPICPTSRYESVAILRRYAERFSRSVAFGVFNVQVPKVSLPDTGTGGEMTVPIGNDAGYLVTLSVGDQLYSQPTTNAPLVKVSTPQTVPGYFFTGTGYIAISIVTGGVQQLAYVQSSDVTWKAKPIPNADCAVKMAQIHALSS